MNDSNIIRMWAVIGASVVLLATVLMGGSYMHTRLFVEGGYHDCVLMGNNSTHWCK